MPTFETIEFTAYFELPPTFMASLNMSKDKTHAKQGKVWEGWSNNLETWLMEGSIRSAKYQAEQQ
eukprot:1607274-Amphidinium_carterae.1